MYPFNKNNLYFVLTSEYAKGRPAAQIAEEALSAGVDILQMREKDLSKEELTMLGKKLLLACRKKSVPFIVNDDPHIAKEVNADGVHLGQEDIKRYPVSYARKVLGRDKIIGISTHSLKELEKANSSDCDYAAFGPVFATKTKDYSIGTADVKEALNISRKPLVFIGGVNIDNIDSLIEKGARNIAVIRAIAESDNISQIVKYFKGIITPCSTVS